MAAYEIFIDINPDPQTEGITILAELTGGEAARIRSSLKNAFDAGAVLDYGVDFAPGIIGVSEAEQRVLEIIGRGAKRNK